MPLILSTGTWAIQEFVDRMFLAWYSPTALAAVMPASILNFSFLSFFLGLASYVSTFAAQYFGAGRFERIGPAIWQGIYVAIIGGLVLAGLGLAAGPIFDLVGHDLQIRAQEVLYFRILCYGSIFMMASSALGGFFTGLGRPWPLMWINTLATILNIILNYALIFGHWGFPSLGIRGAAYATVLSVALGLVIYALLVFTAKNNRLYGVISGWKPERELFFRLIRFGAPAGVQFFLEILGFTIFVLFVGHLGPDSLAATNIALNINALAFMPMIGASIGISVLVGQYLGAGQPDLAQKAVYSGFHVTLVYTAAIALAYVLTPWLFIYPFAALADAGQYGRVFDISLVLLRFVAAYAIFDTMNIVFCAAIKGAGDTRFVMLSMVVISFLVMALPLYLIIFVFKQGLYVSWIMITANVMTLGLVFFFRFSTGKWKEMRVIEEVRPKL